MAVISQGLCTLLCANKVIAERLLHLPPLFVPPEGPFHVYWRMKGDLLVYGLMMPFQVRGGGPTRALGYLGYIYTHINFGVPSEK